MKMTINDVHNANREIITQEALMKGFKYDDNNLDTFDGWEEKGYYPRRGQKAYIRTHLWTKGKNRRKILEYLFRYDQVEKIGRDMLISV